ncbi:hypothetical protein C806_04522 [Lachnospiraceae bacterium 3-1]|nr:hypothetical protein C806_04522 [Lachnospiraceae bacterium 3-1]
MISFESDYTTGAHPRILERLAETNLEAVTGYGTDFYCESAREKIRDACGCKEAQVYFLVGGTQTNAVVISSMLRRYEGVVAVSTGHINVHEAGAIEYTGHKVLALPCHLPERNGEVSKVRRLTSSPKDSGKMDADNLKEFLQKFYQDDSRDHMVFPGMVYLSYPTEYGTLYSKKELEAIALVCREYEMPLFLDGARLGYGLMSLESDMTMQDIAKLCDVFYIGGTKVGALCGEAVVFPRGNAPKHFLTAIKQHGAMLAKGRLLGIQFDTLFTENLYLDISRHAIEMAEQLKKILREKGCTFYLESSTNQQFIILEDGQLKKLREHVAVSFWEKADDTHTVVRLVTSWSTRKEDLEQLEEALEICC